MISQNEFSQWLVAQLEHRGWSRIDLSRQCGVSHVAITHVINGERNPGPDLCRAIARAFEMPEEEVFRLAGLLPNLPAIGDDFSFHDVYEMMKTLTPEERLQVMEYVEWQYRQHKAKA